jgi:predicted MFS family arabinose efflux permease
VVSIGLLYGIASPATFLVATCLFTFAFGLGIPYMVAIVAELDVDGRFVVLTVPAIGIGLMLAPALGGMLRGFGGQTALLLAGGLSVLVALALALLALGVGMPSAKQLKASGRDGAL